MNPEPSNIVNGAWMPTVVFDERESGVTREKFAAAFTADNIDARVFFYPLSGLPTFEALPSNRHAWSIPERAMNLPSYHDMTDPEQERDVRTLQRVRGPSSMLGCQKIFETPFKLRTQLHDDRR